MHRKANASVLRDLRMSGCLKLFFLRADTRADGIIINSSGGLTSGDRLSLSAEVADGASLALTTQAAERAYRAMTGPAQVQTALRVGPQADMLWLPQELILFDGAALDRELHCDLAPGAHLLLVEPVIFGRAQMGETLRDVWFRDRILINQEGVPLYRDAMHFDDDIPALLAGAATVNGAGAMANVVCVRADADAQYRHILPDLPATAGASLLASDLLVMRILAEDGFALRKTLLPILDRLTGHTLPTSWRL